MYSTEIITDLVTVFHFFKNKYQISFKKMYKFCIKAFSLTTHVTVFSTVSCGPASEVNTHLFSIAATGGDCIQTWWMCCWLGACVVHSDKN